MSPTAPTWIDYDYALLRLVPRVHLGDRITVGVLLQARTVDYLDLRLRVEPEAWARRFPGLDVEMALRGLEAYARICAGGPEGGPIGLLPPSERFHWLTAPRSAVLQSSAVHGGRSRDPAATLERLFADCVPSPSDQAAVRNGEAGQQA